MKRVSILFILAMCTTLTFAQRDGVKSFFTEKGTVDIETLEANEKSDTIVKIYHRSDDVVWSKEVYRIIDMRYKQNYQLYYPTNPKDPRYWSLYRLIFDGVYNGKLPIYFPNLDGRLEPDFSDENIMQPGEYYESFQTTAMNPEDLLDPNVRPWDNSTLFYDSVEGSMGYDFGRYKRYVKNQLKYLIKEVVFFDKHYSRLYSKIIAIAPLYAPKTKDATSAYDALCKSVEFWVLFDDLAPMLDKYMVPGPMPNQTDRLTFYEFFVKHLYSSYIVGQQNMYQRMILEDMLADGSSQDEGGGDEEGGDEDEYSDDEENYDEEEGSDEESEDSSEESGDGGAVSRLPAEDAAMTEDYVHKEQQRIFDELLNFEQDLWEY